MEALAVAGHILNRCLTQALHLSMLFQALTSIKLALSHLRVLGYTTFVYTFDQSWTKFTLSFIQDGK